MRNKAPHPSTTPRKPPVASGNGSPRAFQEAHRHTSGCTPRPGESSSRPFGGAALGIYAEKYSTLETARVTADPVLFADTGEGTGELVAFKRQGVELKPVVTSQMVRVERFAMKAAARRLLPKNHRTTKCMNWRLPNMEVQVLKGATTNKAFYHGLQVCAMPWACPVCASKISERRRAEVFKGMKQAEVLGLQVALVTLTVPHGLGDDVSSVVDGMSAAWTRLWQGRQGMEFRESLGLFGHIRALEVTHGANGFHPHFHALMFFHPAQVHPGAWEKFGPRWQTVAVRSGLPRPSDERGCKIDDGKKAAAYVAKGVWGLESELTKGHVKTGKKGSRTPFDLLRAYMAGDKAAGALWRVYVDAFTGRRQLHWSVGLKKLLAIADLSDDEIANKPDDERSLLQASITDEQWRLIYRRGFESAVLDLAEVSVDVLLRFLASLVPENSVEVKNGLQNSARSPNHSQQDCAISTPQDRERIRGSVPAGTKGFHGRQRRDYPLLLGHPQ